MPSLTTKKLAFVKKSTLDSLTKLPYIRLIYFELFFHKIPFPSFNVKRLEHLKNAYKKELQEIPLRRRVCWYSLSFKSIPEDIFLAFNVLIKSTLGLTWIELFYKKKYFRNSFKANSYFPFKSLSPFHNKSSKCSILRLHLIMNFSEIFVLSWTLLKHFFLQKMAFFLPLA